MAGGPGVDSFVGGPGDDATFAQQSDDQPFGSAGVVTWVNPAPLGPAGAIAGEAIVNDGDPTFSDRCDSDLQALLSVPAGRRLLEAIGAAGKRVELRDDENRNATTILDTAAAMLLADGRPSAGSACTVAYNTWGTVAGNGAMEWMHRPPVIGLVHELVHVFNATHGTMQPGAAESGVPRLELQAIGLPFDGILWDNDGNQDTPAQTGNPVALTENGFRALMNLPVRADY